MNAIGNGSFSTAVSYTVPALAPTPPQTACLPIPLPAGLVLAMGMNENTGTTVADSSGQGNQGTISGATWTASGQYGAALTFDGVNDWVTVANSPSLHLTTGMTLSAWIFPLTLSAGDRIVITKENPPSPASYALLANSNSNRPFLWIFGQSVLSGPSQLSLNV